MEQYNLLMLDSWINKPEYEPAPPVEMNPWYDETLRQQHDMDDWTVYLIENGDHYKIGISKNADARLTLLQQHLPTDARLVAVRAGGRRLERQLHDALRHRQSRGEWFDKCAEVFTTFIETRETGDERGSIGAESIAPHDLPLFNDQD